MSLFVAGYHDIGDAGFPKVLCPVIFLEGCNFQCPFCLNSKLVKNKDISKIPAEFIVDRYKEKGEKEILISGGEPCLNKNIFEYISFFSENGFGIRLSTNGSFPEKLNIMIKEKMISFVAMDIKTSFLDKEKWKVVSSDDLIMEKTISSMEIVEQSTIDFEFRTTLFPPLVSIKDIESISNTISTKSLWVLQQFRQKQNLLSEEKTKNVIPYSNDEINDMVVLARKKIKNVEIGYV